MEENIMNEMFVETVSDSANVVAEGVSKEPKISLVGFMAIMGGCVMLGAFVGNFAYKGVKSLAGAISRKIDKAVAKNANKGNKNTDTDDYGDMNIDAVRTDDIDLGEVE